MKTAEALKIAAGLAAAERADQLRALSSLEMRAYSTVPTLRAGCKRTAKEHGARADALDQLRADHQQLRSELTKVRGMLAYVLDGLRADRVDLDGGNKDVRHMKQQLKVAAHILKVTKP